MKWLWCSLVLLVSVLWTPVFAETDVFLPRRGLLVPELFEGRQMGREVGGVFQNPAQIAQANTSLLKLDSSQDFFGYSDVTVGVVQPLTFGVVGLGYHWFGTSGIPEVVRINGAKPVQTGSLNHGFKTYTVSYGYSLSHRFHLGGHVRYVEQVLAGDSAGGYYVDLGGLWDVTDYFWVGGYTQYLSGLTLEWENSSQSEDVDRYAVLESGINIHPFFGKVTYDDTHLRTRLEWAAHSRFSLITDSLWLTSMDHLRYGYGALIEFDGFALFYLHLHYTETDFGLSQDLFGILFRFR